MNYFATLCVVALSVGAMVLGDVTCPQPGNKETFYPDPTNCSRYIECYAGKASEMDCPPDLYWNQEKQYCDYKANVQCTVDPTAPTRATQSTSAATTSEPRSTTSNFTPDPHCPYPSDAITYDYYPGNCSLFYECDHGQRYLMQCPPNRLWNHIKNYCDFPEEVDCTRSNSTSTGTPGPSTTPGTPGTTTVDPICNGQPDGAFIASTTDCAQYYECLRDQSYLYTCPAGTYWDEDEKTCDYIYNVDCKVTTPVTKGY